jgi:hypothetical protein
MGTQIKASGTSLIKLATMFALLLTGPALANPVVDPTHVIGSVMVLGSLLMLEASIATMALLFFGMSPKPVFFAILLGNIGMYFVVFWPMYEVLENLFIAESIIVFAEATLIKLVARLDFFQLDTFRGIGWKSAIVISVIGNLLSYYVGTIIIH